MWWLLTALSCSSTFNKIASSKSLTVEIEWYEEDDFSEDDYIENELPLEREEEELNVEGIARSTQHTTPK